MRLIDAENFSKSMKDYFTDMIINRKYNVDCVDCNADLQRLLDNHPTTYDVDKVVEELEKAKHEIASEDYCRSINDKEKCDGRNCFECCAEYLIEIVKHVVISDDVCEWKSASDGEFIQNPHTKRLYSNEPSMKNIYCNTCGKKIKVVE